MKTTFAIGCLIQWYEVMIIEDYFRSLKNAIEYYNSNVLVDILLVTDESLEKPTTPEDKVGIVRKIQELGLEYGYEIRLTNELVTIADYRRTFNNSYCNLVDVLVWGESDMLVPRQMFTSLDMLHQHQSETTPKYLCTFGICKMWDDSWKELEHPEFSVHNHSDSKEDWWGVNYDMTIEEMNSINDKVTDLSVKLISPHKFNGCGLVISSEVVRAGVNIPLSVFFVHEDTAFMFMTQKLLGQIPQYHFSNILLVHNRKHSNKRMFIKNEIGSTIGEKRKSQSWYVKANKLSELNCYNLFNANFKSYTWKDVLVEKVF